MATTTTTTTASSPSKSPLKSPLKSPSNKSSSSSSSSGNQDMRSHLHLWQGDITKITPGTFNQSPSSGTHLLAVVNAANESLLGGGGVDGAIHRAAGPQLLQACRKLKGCPVGEVRVTDGYRLPADFIVHTVGPIYHRLVKKKASLSMKQALVEGEDQPQSTGGGDSISVENSKKRRPESDNEDGTSADGGVRKAQRLLSACYRKSLDAFVKLCKEKLDSIAADETERSDSRFYIAFPCISTGVYGYPPDDAAQVALQAVREWFTASDGQDREGGVRRDGGISDAWVRDRLHVMFCVFLDSDYEIYAELLAE